jgi:cystathionine gamma-lyase
LLGADFVTNSATKYIGGHADIIMGTMTTNSKELNDRLYFNVKSLGAVPSPFDCYLAVRSLKTLKLRMEQHCKNAMIIADFLD